MTDPPYPQIGNTQWLCSDMHGIVAETHLHHQIGITQWLCANRHCIVAEIYLWDVEAGEPEKAEQLDRVRRECRQGFVKYQFNPWCGLCGDPKENWNFEDAIVEARGPDGEYSTLLALQKVKEASDRQAVIRELYRPLDMIRIARNLAERQ